MSDLRLAFDGVKVEDLHPRVLPDLFRGSQLMVVGRYLTEGDAKVTLKGQVNGRAVEYTWTLKIGGAAKMPSIPRLWAVRRVGFLLDQIRLSGESKEMKDEVVRLGVRYGIVTPYTSYLVVEDAVAGTPNAPGLRRRGETGLQSGYRGLAGGDAGTLRPGLSAAPAGGAGAPVSGGAGGGRGGRQGGALDAEAKASRDKGAPPEPAREDAPSEAAKAPADHALLEMEKLAQLSEKADRDSGDDASYGVVDDLDGKRRSGLPTAVGLGRDRTKAGDDVRLGFLSDSVALSRRLKDMRESERQDSGAAGALIKRVGARTFYYRYGMYVESVVLDVESAALTARLTRVALFSDAYFDLLAKQPSLAPVLALGAGAMFVDGDRVMLITPAVAESRPAVAPAPDSRPR